MTHRRRIMSRRLAAELTLAALVLCIPALGLSGIRISYAGSEPAAATTSSAGDDARQVTVFAVIATPGRKTADSNLTTIHAQLDKLLPGHGFKLLDAQSKRVETGEAVTCKLKKGYVVSASLVRSADENGKAHIRCELLQGEEKPFSTLVKTPLNQLFFCQRALEDGSQLLIGVGAR